MLSPALRPRERDALIQSLRAGVTPRLGARHIQVGRDAEIAALDKDLNRIADGGSAFRLVIGEYGSGKTFFLNLVRGEAMGRQLVVAHADLNPGRRLQASGGEARSLYAELMKNMATRTKTDGGALTTIVEKFITTALAEARKNGRKPEDIIHERLENLSELVMGYDFATVIAAYWRAYEKGDDNLKANAIRWLRGEFSAKTDARQALGVREIIGDAALYDALAEWLLALAKVGRTCVSPAGVECAVRWQGERRLFFVLNHTVVEQRFTLPEPLVDLASGEAVATSTLVLGPRQAVILAAPAAVTAGTNGKEQSAMPRAIPV